jgi:hypothetical protein
MTAASSARQGFFRPPHVPFPTSKGLLQVCRKKPSFKLSATRRALLQVAPLAYPYLLLHSRHPFVVVNQSSEGNDELGWVVRALLSTVELLFGAPAVLGLVPDQEAVIRAQEHGLHL